MGDFNALCASDYSQQEWADLVKLAEDRGWEPRQERAYRRLASSGWEDAGAGLALQDGFTYTLTLGGGAEASAGQGRTHPLRIDYAFLRTSASAALRTKPRALKAHHRETGSNHCPISATFYDDEYA